MDSFERFKNLISQIDIDPKIAIMVVSVILIFVFEIILLKKGIINDRKNNGKKVEKAKRLNHIVKAKRVNVWDDGYPNNSVNSYWHAKYVYNINSKEYVYRYLGKSHPPYELTLYYINNPKRTFFYEEKQSSIFNLIFYLLPIIVGYIVITLLGGI